MLVKLLRKARLVLFNPATEKLHRNVAHFDHLRTALQRLSRTRV